jgi:hypothetical protein
MENLKTKIREKEKLMSKLLPYTCEKDKKLFHKLAEEVKRLDIRIRSIERAEQRELKEKLMYF